MSRHKPEKALWCYLGGLLLPVLSGGIAHADDELFFQELPIVASVSRLPQRLADTPAAVTVIDQEMIRASGLRTLEDLLRLVPGFQVTSHNQDPAIVAYHGLNSGLNSDEYGPRVQVLIDGRSQYSPLFKSGVNWNLLPVALENIDRIEVIRGSNTVSYGSNAFMGVVNIITLDPSLTRGWLFSANNGNNGISDQTVRWGGGTDDTKIRMTYRSLADNGFQNGKYGTTWRYTPDNRQSQLFDIKVDSQLTNQDELQFTASFARDLSQYGRPGSPENDPIRTLEQTSSMLGMQWRRVISADEEFTLRYSFVEDWAYGPYRQRVSFSTNTKPTSVTFFQMFDPGGKSQVHELDLEHRYKLMPGLRLSWGGGARDISLYSPAQFTTHDWLHRDVFRGFANVEYQPVEKWLFNIGASLERDSRSGWLLDGRAGVSYHVNNENTLRLVLSQAHRTPSLYEVAGKVQKTDPVKLLSNIEYLAQGVSPERIDTIEVGYLGEFKSIRASADVRAFIERIPNNIQIVPLALPATMPDDNDGYAGRLLAQTHPALANTIFPFGRADGAINLEDVRIRGYEYQLRWRPFETTRLIYSNSLLSIDASYNNVSVIADATGYNTDKIIQQTRESAPHRAQSAMLIQHLPYDIQASVMYFRSGTMRWRRNGEPVIESERFDWRLAKGFRWGATRGELAYTMQMVNHSQQGRQPLRLADSVQWLSLSLGF